MNKLIFLSLFFLLTLAQGARAQVDTMQDRPEIHWSEIESEDFKVVYPTHMRAKARYVLNLLRHYKDITSESYDIRTQKYTVIIRSEQAAPNGFVTLAPRRSEFFSASAFSPLVSSLEWYQSLAVHEYRHMVQFDYINRPRVNWGYFLFGEIGQAALMAMTAPPWYFEGDAVWAETALSNAGRGRAPRFSARMKSLMINNHYPTYDEFIGGVYDTVLPNHYVYGYFLIARAYKKFGEKAWKEIISRSAERPYNPYTFYNAFKWVTGLDFETFYNETLEELKSQWGEEVQESNALYTQYEYPIVDDGKLYYLKWDLDSFWGLYSDGGKTGERIKELNIAPSLSKVDLKRGKFAYSQLLPHYRYGYRDFSDIFLLDIDTGEEKRITDSGRFYHPTIHPERDELMAVEFVDSLTYRLSFFDFEGKKTKSVVLDDYQFAEAIWLTGDSVLAILLDRQGMKHIARVDVKTREVEILKKAGRNNIYAMRGQENQVYFEADDRGAVSIFSYDLTTDVLARCASEEIAAFRPYPDGDKIHYVAEVDNGQNLSQASANCETVPGDFLTKYDLYLGDTPSDAYVESPPVELDNFEELYEKDWEEKDYFEPENGLTPHSWSFIGGRGFQLQAFTSNYLNTFSAQASVGEDAEESRPFADLTLSWKKYYPILSLSLNYQERNTEDAQWSEASAGLGVSLPYVFRKGLYNGAHVLSLGGRRLEISDRESAEVYEASDEQLFIQSVSFSTSLLKRTRYRELQPSWGYSLRAQYLNADAQTEGFSSYTGYGQLNLYAPGAFINQGTRLSLSGEYRTENNFAYRISSPAEQVNDYAFSRGYDYAYVDAWQKASLNYVLPVSYPNRALGRWVYFNRIYSNLYFDHTKIMDFADINLNSAGAELFFESLTLRKLPLTYGFRYGHKFEESESFGEFFFLVNVAI